MKKLLDYLISNITDSKPKIESKIEGNLNIFSIKVPSDQIGKVIGKDGKIIRAIRTLAKTRAISEEIAVAIKLEEQNTQQVKK